MSLKKWIEKLFNFPKKTSSSDNNDVRSKKRTQNLKKNTPYSSRKKHTTQKKSTSKNSKLYKDKNQNKPFSRRKSSGTKKEPSTRSVPENRQKKPFSELGLDTKLLQQLKDNQFEFATEVQEKSIPHTLAGKNIFCSSATGSGKTLSFLLPMIHKFYIGEINQALIVCPTREIAIQIQKNLHLFKDPKLTNALVIGGTNMVQQKQDLQQYPKILIATPGRLLDMLKTGLIWLQYTEYLVLDEADRMLDMGFEEDLIKIHNELSGTHQTVLFSATLFPAIKKMAERYGKEYEEIVIGKPTDVAKTIEHLLVDIPYKEKIYALKHLIQKKPGKKIIFFNTIRETTAITDRLESMGIRNIRCIHSKIDQSKRERIIQTFKNGSTKTLLASDVAARGIDVADVDLVINYDIPNNSEEYIHRVGRTGRAGKTGQAISFYTPRDKQRLEAVEKLIKNKIKKKRSYKDL